MQMTQSYLQSWCSIVPYGDSVYGCSLKEVIRAIDRLARVA